MYDNLNALGRTTIKLEGVVMWIMAAMLLAWVIRYAAATRRRRGEYAQPDYAKLSILIVVMVLCGSLMFSLAGMNTPFARVLRAFSAGSIMAAPFMA